jgi:ribonuclease HI
MKVYIWCDGAAKPNPGHAGAGYVIAGGVHYVGSDELGRTTNNRAEYTAILNALQAAAAAGATSAHVRMDSKVVYDQLTGKAKAKKEPLKELKADVDELVKTRYFGRVTFERIPRKLNGVADQLAQDAALASKARGG